MVALGESNDFVAEAWSRRTNWVLVCYCSALGLGCRDVDQWWWWRLAGPLTVAELIHKRSRVVMVGSRRTTQLWVMEMVESNNARLLGEPEARWESTVDGEPPALVSLVMKMLCLQKGKLPLYLCCKKKAREKRWSHRSRERWLIYCWTDLDE